MRQNQTISTLIQDCIDYFEQNCYTKHRVDRYKSMWKNGISSFMKDRAIQNYNYSVGEQFIQANISSTVTPSERDIIRSISVLDDMLTTGKISKKMVHRVTKTPELTGPIGEAIKCFLARLRTLRRSQSTIHGHLLYLHRFYQYLKNDQIILLENIDERHIISFISTQTNSNINVASSLRLFFRHFHEEGMIETDYSYILANYKWVKREKLPSFYTAEEVKQIESSVRRSSGVGKRNYALLLLATRLGLRASDIAGLLFTNIDWDNSLITLQQRKTAKEIELPLLTQVGEAIINYLKFGRPQSSSAQIFLSARAPYRPMTGAAVSSAVRQIIDSSGICIGVRRHGPHSMRHSLASRLLENSVSLSVISESLGHKTTETTMTYLRIDIKALRECALEVPVVAEEFYNQKNGTFYE